MGRKEKIVVGLDIGSTKVCTLIVAERPSAASGIEAIGFGIAESKGMKRGAIVNLVHQQHGALRMTRRGDD